MQTVKAYINLRAIINNIKVIKRKVPYSKIIAVVKANAYGHGVLEISKYLTDYADCYAVARLDEALYLRNNHVEKDILILGGFLNEEDLIQISNNNIQIVLHDYSLLTKIEKLNITKPIKCWLKLDTGMHRLGVLPNEADSFYERIINCKNIAKPIGLLSHLCVADDNTKKRYTQQQISIFNSFKNKHPECITALANSAGIFSYPESHTDYVRPGIVLYGVSPYSDISSLDLGLEPVMTLTSKVIAKKKLRKGEGIGYGLSYVAEEDTCIGVLGIGYGDGYPRQAPNGTPVLINGRTVYSVGHVCMDMMFVNLGASSKDKIGDEVILWGSGLPVETIAKKVGTIPYELVLRLTSRVQFTYIKP